MRASVVLLNSEEIRIGTLTDEGYCEAFMDCKNEDVYKAMQAFPEIKAYLENLYKFWYAPGNNELLPNLVSDLPGLIDKL